MEALTCTLALLCALSDPDLGYSAKADRARFPPDEVLRQWINNNCRRREQLQEMRAGVQLVTLRPDVREDLRERIDAELGEMERISCVMAWLLGEGVDECVMRGWMRTARGYMTDAEYWHGKVSWGGLPE